MQASPNQKASSMPPVLRYSDAPHAASPQGRREAPRPGDQELAGFDLRDALAGITVRETSFSEFLAALRQAGRKPA